MEAISTDNIMSQTMFDVVITLPLGTFEQLVKGHVELLKSDTKSGDVQMDIKPDGYNRRTIPKSTLAKGTYKARVRWTNGDKEFYKEETVMIQ